MYETPVVSRCNTYVRKDISNVLHIFFYPNEMIYLVFLTSILGHSINVQEQMQRKKIIIIII